MQCLATYQPVTQGWQSWCKKTPDNCIAFVKQLNSKYLMNVLYCESMLCSITYIFIKSLNVFNVNLYLFNLNVWEVIIIIMYTLLLEGNLM